MTLTDGLFKDPLRQKLNYLKHLQTEVREEGRREQRLNGFHGNMMIVVVVVVVVAVIVVVVVMIVVVVVEVAVVSG